MVRPVVAVTVPSSGRMNKRGSTITLTVHIVLARDMRVSFLDSVRKEMMMCIKNSFRWSDIDIVFTIDPSWMKYSVPLPDETQII